MSLLLFHISLFVLVIILAAINIWVVNKEDTDEARLDEFDKWLYKKEG